MKLGKDDPIYYKEAMNKLIAQARNNGIKVQLDSFNKYLYFSNLNCKIGVKLEDKS